MTGGSKLNWAKLFQGLIVELDRGYLVAFEGIDGTGKSTSCDLLAQYFQNKGLPVLCLREPTQGVWGQKIRNMLVRGRGEVSPAEELAWFVNDRKEDVERNIRPALDQKKIVLMDRYYFSTTAYQGALGLDPETILRENEAFAPMPDRVFIFTAPLAVCLERICQSRNAGPDAFEKREYLEKVQKIFDTFTGPRFRRVDSSVPQEKVQACLRDEMIALLPGYLS